MSEPDLKIDWNEFLDRLLKYFKTPAFWISLAIVVVAVVVWQVLKRVRKKYLIKDGKYSSTATHVLFDVGRGIFIFAVLVSLLQLNGIDIGGIMAGVSVVSLIIGLAFQDFLKDMINGAKILTDKFFSVGDVVRYRTVGGSYVEGEVIAFNLRVTKILLVSYQEVMTISNRNISEIQVLSDMFDLDVNIPYSVDPKRVHSLMEDLVAPIGEIEGVTKSMYKGTQEFNDSSISYRLRYWTSPKGSRCEVRRQVHRIVQEGMNKADIPFAFNHLDVELVNASEIKK